VALDVQIVDFDVRIVNLDVRTVNLNADVVFVVLEKLLKVGFPSIFIDFVL
jgi:hypothetical protein